MRLSARGTRRVTDALSLSLSLCRVLRRIDLSLLLRRVALDLADRGVMSFRRGGYPALRIPDLTTRVLIGRSSAA